MLRINSKTRSTVKTEQSIKNPWEGMISDTDQCVKVLAFKADDLNLMFMTCMVERENQL